MYSLIIEIRSGEGGADAKLLVVDQLTIYKKYARRLHIPLEVLDNKIGFVRFRVAGKNCLKAFGSEAGGHRFQRVPPTEKKGRRQSSTITVAVLEEPKAWSLNLPQKDLRMETYRGSGPGGQHRNKTDTCVRITHIPTGTQACGNTKSQAQNKILALDTLRARLRARQAASLISSRNRLRREQLGTGERSDKIRTFAEQRGRVECHKTGKRISIKAYLNGELEGLL